MVASQSAQNRRLAALENLEAGLRDLTSAERWRSWLEFCRRFHQYSFHNQILILAQCPEATRVAGYQTWRQLGRQVRRGERGIKIMAPCRSRPLGTDPETPGVDPAPIRFRMVPVFDLSQTEGEAIPTPVAELDDRRPHPELNNLLARADEAGFAVEFTELWGGRHGDCSHALRRIRVDCRLAAAQQIKTMAHELAHALLHGPDFGGGRALAELEAESVAFVTCCDLGIDSSAYSFGYLATWAGSGPDAATAISAAGSRIVRAVAAILDRFPAGGSPEAAQAAGYRSGADANRSGRQDSAMISGGTARPRVSAGSSPGQGARSR